jgi:hypothetical protein
MWLAGIVVILVGLAVSYPMIFRQRHIADCTQAINNMRSLSCAFLEFDQEYGSYPNDQTAQKVIDSTGSELDFTGPHSNAYFRQLIAYGIQSEDIFYAVHPEGSRKPDRIMSPGHALAPGEVGLSYFYGLDSSADLRIPLLLAPMKTGTHLAWRRPFDKKAAVLLIDRGRDPFDNPPFDLDRHGEILLSDGSLLLDPTQPYFHKQPIDIRHPEFP